MLFYNIYLLNNHNIQAIVSSEQQKKNENIKENIIINA